MPAAPGVIKERIRQTRDFFFTLQPEHSGLDEISGFTKGIDALLQELYADFKKSRTLTGDSCLLALGGYGRSELCPYSDIDLLILCEKNQGKSAFEPFIRYLWDIGLMLGCSIRTIEETSAILGDDYATDTALLTARFIDGSNNLFKTLSEKTLRPYFERQKRPLIKKLCQDLHDSIKSSGSSPYRIEPDLKNGSCTLRDCLRLRWIGQLEKAVIGIDMLPDCFSNLQKKTFAEAYSFFLCVRAKLHTLAGCRMDTLEISLQPDIAQSLGFANTEPALLMEQFFRHAREIKFLIVFFLEHIETRHANLWTSVLGKVSRITTAPGLYMTSGTLFLSKSHTLSQQTPEFILTIFYQAVRYQANLSVNLRIKIVSWIRNLSADEFRNKKTGSLFHKILAWPGPVATVLRSMHETGTLGRLIPQFNALICKVEYDAYHEYTIDEHILLTIENADNLQTETDLLLRTTYRSLRTKTILRLALLLHDVGKALPGNHSITGVMITKTLGELLGYSDEDVERVAFLVRYHLSLSELSLNREPEEPVIADFARSIGNLETLNHLYLLTVVDIRSVGNHTWTGWKAAQLEQIYHDTKLHLPMEGQEKSTVANSIQHPEELARPLEPKEHKQVYTDNELLITAIPLAGFERITIYGRDRIGFLADIIGCFSSEGYNILSASISAPIAGIVRDIFHCEPPEEPRISLEKRTASIAAKWKLLTKGSVTAQMLVDERIKKYPPKHIRKHTANSVKLHLDLASSAHAAILEIKTADNFGLLHKIAHTLSIHQINIISARLSTRADQAKDVFYITYADGKKIADAKELNQLMTDLKQELLTH